MDWFKQLITDNFVTLLLVALLISSTFLVVHLFHHDADTMVVGFGLSLANNFSGALLLRLNGGVHPKTEKPDSKPDSKPPA